MENLEFLSDVVPKTTTYKQVKQRATKETAPGAGVVGQGTLDQHMSGVQEPQIMNGSQPIDVMDTNHAATSSTAMHPSNLSQDDDASMSGV